MVNDYGQTSRGGRAAINMLTLAALLVSIPVLLQALEQVWNSAIPLIPVVPARARVELVLEAPFLQNAC
jgi:hypothetical protein